MKPPRWCPIRRTPVRWEGDDAGGGWRRRGRLRTRGPRHQHRGPDLAAGYGSQPVIHDVDLLVRPGEVVTLLGPNGAGKTTTLLTLAGELRPSAGEVLLMAG